MTSLLCQKTTSGVIVAGDQELFNHLLNDRQKIMPYLIKEKNLGSVGDLESPSVSEIAKSARYSLKNGTSLKNNVMFNIPATPNNSKPTTQSNSKAFKNNQLSVKSSSNQNMSHISDPSVRRRELNASSTILSSVPQTHSSMSTTSNMEKQFNGNKSFQHEKKRISKKKLKGIQQQLENRLNLKSATTTDLYKELNKIVSNEKTLAQKVNTRIDQCEREKVRKREMIYKNWYRNVYEPMQTEIYKTMLSNSAEYARNFRNLKYLEYLNQCNQRNSCYQDDFEPAEYDPVSVVNLDASVGGRYLDPTTLPQRKEMKEVNMISQDIRLPIITKYDSPRSDVVWNNWVLDQYNTIDSTVRSKSAKKCNTSRHSAEYNLEWDRGNPTNKGLLANSVNNFSNDNYFTQKSSRVTGKKSTESCLDFNNCQINFIADDFRSPSMRFEYKQESAKRVTMNQK